MPAWITLTPALVAASGHATIITTAQTTALQPGQSDPLPELIAEVTAKVRNAIGFKTQGVLDATATTVPPSLVPDCARYIVRQLKGRLNKELTKKEEQDAADWRTMLGKLTTGEWPVEAPLNPVEPTAQPAAGMGVSVVTRSRPQAQRHNLRGL